MNSLHPGVEIAQQVCLQALNSLALPARAEYFCSVDSLVHIQQALQFARARQLPVTPLGGGSNVVLAGDITGLVLHINLTGVHSREVGANEVEVTFAAGENWHQMVLLCLQQGWYGLENLSLIPGNVGAAPVQNIGAYGVELCDRFVSLQAVEIHSGKLVCMDRAACEFGYRDSIFKHRYRDQYLITEVRLLLSKQAKINDHYPSLKQALGNTLPTPESVSAAVCDIRRQKLPDPAEIANVGSFFKNPLVSASLLDELLQHYPDMPSYPQSGGYCKISAAWLIDQCGFRGERREKVAVHRHQALVLLNYGGTGAEILHLAGEISAAVKATFSIQLEIEPRIYGHS